MSGQARRRLDAELVRRRLARSREQAVELIAAGRVTVGGQRAAKAATQVETSAAIVVVADPAGDPGYASRGGHKLAGALAAFVPSGLRVAGRRCLDAGASTGGFTDVLLRAGARQVVAVDVGYGQLVWELRNDPRVVVVDRTNVRELTLDQIGGEPAELVVGDLSFISLTLVLPALVRCAEPDADLALMVKPQFEVGRERLGSGGVVRDPVLHAESVRTVASAAQRLGLGVLGVKASPLPGPSGNVEYFLWLRRGAAALREPDLARAIAQGPAAAAGGTGGSDGGSGSGSSGGSDGGNSGSAADGGGSDVGGDGGVSDAEATGSRVAGSGAGDAGAGDAGVGAGSG
jgi:23S rRNA (cytidine1920-2'-O)/16S rRNA (cytidine1409-2'-O)-methyltransferase